jgi:heme a synthase
MQKTLKGIGILSVLLMILVILAGAVVTKTGSGDGCGPNWPLCHGQLIPSNPTIETVFEYIHRLITLFAGLFVFVFSVWMGIKYRKIKEVGWVVGAAIFFLLLQSGLGAMAVMNDQSAVIMALHFGFSLLSYASVFLLLIYAFQLSRTKSLPSLQISPTFKAWTVTLWIYTYIVVYLGALVRHTSASMGCSGWPLCNGQWIPDNLGGIVGIQYVHRIAALLFLIGFIIYFYRVTRKYAQYRLLLVYASLMFIFAVLQVLTGAWVVLSNMDSVPVLLHSMLITIMFGFLSYVTVYVVRSPSKGVKSEEADAKRTIEPNVQS